MDKGDDMRLEALDGSLMDVSMQEEVSTSLECAVCGKSYGSKATLRRHLKVHDDKYQANCSKCSRFFESQEELDRHNSKCHSRKFLCTECGKQYANKGSLNTHIKQMHTGTGLDSGDVLYCPFDSCGKKFAKRTKYQDHVNKHSGLKPHSCSKCGKKFHDRYHKNEHQKVCVGVKKIQCLHCGVDFCDQAALKKHTDAQHMSRLNVCELCGKKYKYSNSLSRHRNNKHN